MRRLLASTCLFALFAPLHAETTVTTKRTDTVRTATIKSGAADDLRITGDGSLTPNGGTAVTLDSSNKVTNEGTIQITNADFAAGIVATSGSGAIANSGKIILDETYAPTDTDKDGDLDGPFAVGRGRVGIRTAGAFSGTIANSGTVTVEGNDSTGVLLGGKLTGAFTHDGTTGVTGDRAVGVQLGAVDGNVRLAGAISANGLSASAARLDGDINGAVVVQGKLSATGYRATTGADASKLDADDLLQGGPTLSVAGNVSGGIVFAVPPKDASATDNDEDKDGIEDAKEGSAEVTAFGAAPAVQIGTAGRAVAIGAVVNTGTGFGVVVDGTIVSAGVYANVDGTGMKVGGLGGAVTIAGGIGINGSVGATSQRNATALQIGTGASVPEVRVAGTVSATGGSGSGAVATAILVDGGANVTTIRNSGTIKATAGGNDASALAIADRAGTVTLVGNSGTISASGALAASDRNVALDLSNNGNGVTVRQTVVASGTAPAITGDIRFGGGSDVLDVADGTVQGKTSFGAGANRLTLSGDAAYSGTASFGAGNDAVSLAGSSTFDGAFDFGSGADTLTLAGTARVSASFANARGLAVAVNGGTLNVARGAAVGSLSVAQGGVLGVTLDKSAGAGTLIDVAGTASFAAGSELAITLANLTNAEGRYVVLRAGTLTGAGNLASDSALLPFVYKGNVSASGTELAVDIARKSTAELGLNRSQATAFNAVYAALGADQKVATALLGQTDGDNFRKSLRQMLPDHAGGTFEEVTMGSRAFARILADPSAPFKDEGKWGYWISQAAWGTSKSLDDTASYDVTGWGLTGGAEIKTGLGNFGASFGYLWSRDADGSTANEVSANQYELAGYWRGVWDGLQTYARVSGARITFDGDRRFSGKAGNETLALNANTGWDGTLWSAAGGASYEFYSGNFTLRPIVAVDYYRLKEDGHAESGGGRAFDLIVASRTSDELAVTGSVAAGLEIGGTDADSGWFRVELEGGRRQVAGGSLGNTVARFDGGESFTLVPEDRTSGWVGKLRAVGGNSGFRVGGEANVEQQQGRAALSLRATLQLGL
ncbi:autotransporter domain-containing protein [uncultured Sphingomonas sp.]|uniref:autotransporter outer membrane beta-barrel domain-containing protein n=1 Tax=uncultured Sphingomonas sp. TaxID=158754 RepID=UPI0025EB1C30|nr:autotransporter domain-containing protein [uncultured Sphingomonas sp.]